jgi:hypothetical protein
MGETPGGCQTFFLKNVSWRDVWWLLNIYPKECFLERHMAVAKHFSQDCFSEKCLAAMRHFSLKMFPLEVCLAIARRFSPRMFLRD